MNEHHGEEMRFAWYSLSNVFSRSDDHAALWTLPQVTCAILHVSVPFLVI